MIIYTSMAHNTQDIYHQTGKVSVSVILYSFSCDECVYLYLFYYFNSSSSNLIFILEMSQFLPIYNSAVTLCQDI